MRLFIAVALPENARDSLARDLARAYATRSAGRWVPPSQWHVTVKFLGETNDDRVARLVDAVRTAARKTASFRLSLGPWGAFPDRPPWRVLWRGIELGADRLKELADRLDARLISLGFERETHPFVPHVTVARFEGRTGNAVSVPRPPEPPGTPFSVASLDVLESRPALGGAAYPLLARCELGGNE